MTTNHASENAKKCPGQLPDSVLNAPTEVPGVSIVILRYANVCFSSPAFNLRDYLRGGGGGFFAARFSHLRLHYCALHCFESPFVLRLIACSNDQLPNTELTTGRSPPPTHFQYFSQSLLIARERAQFGPSLPSHAAKIKLKNMADDDQRPTSSKSRPSEVDQRSPRRSVRRSVQRPHSTFLDSGSGGSAPRQQQTSHQSQAQVPQSQTRSPTSQNATSHSLQVLDIPTGVPLREFGLTNARSDFATRRQNHEMEMHPDLLFDPLSSGEGKSSGA